MAFSAVVLAGERPGGSDFSRELGLPASVLVEVAGSTAVGRVLAALESSANIEGGVLCGPSAEVYRDNPIFEELLADTSFSWLGPAMGPSASALKSIDYLDRFPVLLTAADHALLTPELVDDFCRQAAATDADAVVGLVPYELVRAAFPDSKRTVLKFSDGQFCGSNLFALLNPAARAAPAFWSRLEADRKRPWRMARRMGPGLLIRYLFGRLELPDALNAVSAAMGCRVGYVTIDNPRAAVDVDSVADRDLAERIIRSESDRSA